MTAHGTDPYCGSETGYMRHARFGTEKCVACRRAHAEKRADYRRRRYLHHAPLSVDATGARRRIHALAAIGWSLAGQSRMLEMGDTAAHKITARKWLHVETAAKVRALYDELSMMPGPSVRARREAQRKGWAPPLAYDDDTIDDPHTEPSGVLTRDGLDEIAVQRASRGERVQLSRAERAEVVRRLTAAGLSAADIADRLGIAQRSVSRLRKAA